MKAVVVKCGTQVKDEEVFSLQDIAMPAVESSDLLVRIAAVGMNPVDTKVRAREEKDTVLGWDAYGVVEEMGVDVQGFNIGDTVYYAGAINRPGCNSEYHAVDYRLAALTPKNLSVEEAVAMPLTSITAWEGLFEKLGFKAEQNGNSGKSILIIGGAGGVGSVAIQLAKWAGIKVYATASRSETNEWCRKLGAHTILNHRNDLFEELKEAGADSVDAIFCTTQMETHWQAMSQCIRPQGRIVLIDDPEGTPNITAFKVKSVALFWELMFTKSLFQTDDMEEQGKLLARVAELLDKGDIVSTHKETVHGLTAENIQKMHTKQESGAMMGKQVLVY